MIKKCIFIMCYYLVLSVSGVRSNENGINRVCPVGYYGSTCTLLCGGNCRQGCEQHSGSCQNNCLPGWTGSFCNQICEEYTYGQDCQLTCGHCANDSICNHVTGNCPMGCVPGFRGKTCKESCDPYTYGVDCSESCGKCRMGKPCNMVTGVCINGCMPGWTGDKCNQACPRGTYGMDCTEKCGNCSEPGTCHPQTGTCSSGCTPGWTGPKCDKICPPGRFGLSCRDHCGHCQNGICNHQTGTCPAGCASGWKGDQCLNACDDGFYGNGCVHTCGKCKNGSCDTRSGICRSGCHAGWQGMQCKLRCNAGFYGQGCKFPCGHCKNGLCDMNSGVCQDGCGEGWEGKYCVDRQTRVVVKDQPQTKKSSPEVPLLLVCIVFLILALSTTVIYFVFIRPRRRRLASRLQMLAGRDLDDVETHLYEQVQTGPWEIRRGNLILTSEKLGHGQFGQVRKGFIRRDRGHKLPVAVKSLKASAQEKDKTDFMNELTILKKVGQHPNVVCLVGSCYIGGTLYVAMEYAVNGDLRSYLRRSRKNKRNLYANVSVFSPLPQSVLLKFALDVASGMAHLAERQIIHRDLAARNVLLDEKLVAKVADFGLSKNDDTYVKTSHTRVPVRWLAVESLFSNKYSSQSDIWSFGILLWEIVTFGGTPYHGMETTQFCNLLKQGYRLRRPRHCEAALYAMMLQCWHEEPDYRPSFGDLELRLQRMLEDTQIYMNFHLDEGVSRVTYTEIDGER